MRRGLNGDWVSLKKGGLQGAKKGGLTLETDED